MSSVFAKAVNEVLYSINQTHPSIRTRVEQTLSYYNCTRPICEESKTLTECSTKILTILQGKGFILVHCRDNSNQEFIQYFSQPSIMFHTHTLTEE